MEKLVSYLLTECFQILDNDFQFYQPIERELFHQKRFYPYSFFDSFAKFQENQLPPINYWTNSFSGSEICLNETKYAHAEKVFAIIGCQTLSDYHNLYLKTDTLLLACVVEEFRKLCYDTYGFDSAHYFTSSHLSGVAFIKICRADLHLLTDREHVEVAENMIGGGVASIFSKRFFTANNKYMDNFNFDNESEFWTTSRR